MTANLSKSRIYLLATLIAMVIMLKGGWQNFNTLTDKVEQQEKLYTVLERWQASWLALRPVEEQYTNTYPALEDLPDGLALYQLLDLGRDGLHVNLDELITKRVQQVSRNGIPLGLQKICVSGRPGYVTATAGTMDRLLSGLQALAQRPEIRLGAFEIGTKDKGVQPIIKLEEVCLLARA
ncbi:hypothetical protein [Marinobacterium stanieri]|uniref:Type II secretion system (T2SS), protein M subtype b n=1 Tax=Marinobacterium stanieri TaxID=49186 RepID=A0A1N6XH24_9GAMM|nr:hypothetical protein [Marinobacterium stanieri]SIR01539.1 hypothetical protein SAMN05421647_11420 [Marinobacterium stanieri]